MTLTEKAKREAKKNGTRVSADVAKGLKAVESMHKMCTKTKGSAYKVYVSQKGK